MKVPRPISAARVIRKEFGAEPMPTMNTRERPALRRDGVEQLLLVADRAVGEEHDLAQEARVALARVGQRRLHRGQHLGAALRLERVDEDLRAPDVLGVGRDGVREEHVHGVVEADHVEAVDRLEAPERVEEARLGLHHRGAAHRARVVDDEDDLARAAVLSLLERGRA